MDLSDRPISIVTDGKRATAGPSLAWRAPLAMGGAAVVACVLFLTLFLSRFEYNASALIGVGDRTMDQVGFAGQVAPGVVVWKDSDGYDGQYYYVIARDPLLREATFLDAFRRQRILYPLAASLLALGQTSLLPYSLLAVNLIGVGAVTFLLALLLKWDTPLSPRWALLGGLGTGMAVSVQNDLPDVLALALCLLALTLYRVRRLRLTTVALALALLTKESAVLFLLAFLLLEVWRGRGRDVLLLVSSVLPYLVYQGILLLGTGQLGLLSSGGGRNLALPLVGIVQGAFQWRYSPWPELARSSASVLAVGIVALGAIAVGPLLWRWFIRPAGENIGLVRRARRAAKTSWDTGQPLYSAIMGMQVMFALVAGSAIWEGYTSVSRLLIALVPAAVLVYGAARREGRVSPALRGLVLACLLLSILTLVRPILVTPSIPFYVR